MAIAPQTGAGNVTTATTGTCDKPTNTASGDLLVALVLVNTANAITWPDGWTADRTSTPTGGQVAIGSIVAGASEPSTYTWSASGATFYRVYIIRCTGAKQTSPYDTGASGSDTDSDSDIVFSSITTAEDNESIIYGIVDMNGGAKNWAWPAGTTEVTGDGTLMALGYEVQASSGASTARTVADGISSHFAWIMGAYKSAAASTTFLPHITRHQYIPELVGR